MSSKIAREIFDYALSSVKPQNFMKNRCALDGNIFTVNDSSYDLSKYKNIYVFGSGKAAFSMAKEIEDILGDKIYKGLVVGLDDKEKLQTIELRKGSHPLPSQSSISSAKSLLKLMKECKEDDLYIYLLSGGSSALIEIPISPITLDELQLATDLMLRNNLEIQEINAVRKHLSQIKGGRLAEQCLASGIVLVLSDVIGDDLYSIGSAPLYADSSSFCEARDILQKSKIYSLMPKSIQDVLISGIKRDIKETPFEPLKRVSHYVLASNKHAKDAAKEYADTLGLNVKVVQESFSGEASQVIKNIMNITKDSKENCLIFGGECTVKVRGDGVGGRNQHTALLALQAMKDENIELTFLSAGTDGVDGNSDATGAVFDFKLSEKVDSKMIETYLKNCNSYNFFKRFNALVVTGASGTNVIDLIIIIKGDVDV